MDYVPAHLCGHFSCGVACTWPQRRAVLIGEHLARQAQQRSEAASEGPSTEPGAA